MAAKSSTKKSAKKKSPGKKSAAKKSARTSTKKKPSGKKSGAKKESAAKKKSAAKKRNIRRGLAITAGVAAAAAVAAGVAMHEAAAACTIKKRGHVSRLVLDFLSSIGFHSAVEGSDFTSDIVVSSNARRGWATPIRDAVSAKGCDAGAFGPDDCSNAAKVGDIVDSLAGAMHV